MKIRNARLLCASIILLSFALIASAQAPKLPEGMVGPDTNDPRTKLSAGLHDAGVASSGLKLTSSYKKPSNFLPSGESTGEETRRTQMAKKIGFSNTDIAFQDNKLFLGNYFGINIYDISDAGKAELITSMVCPGGQGDVSVYKNLMFMSVEAPNGRLDCGAQGFARRPDRRLAAEKDRFRGIRIFDISNIREPKQVGAVQSCRGSHTHTLVKNAKDKDNVYIYISGASYVRANEELEGCKDGPPATTPDSSRFSIDIVKVPLAAPGESKIISSPRLFTDETGKINALKDAGSHARKGKVRSSDHCHDITVYEEFGIAAGACSGNGILIDISDPEKPRRINSVKDKNFAYWHSATFSNDGSKVVFTDEWGGGGGARCRATDPMVWGANALFSVKEKELKFVAYHKLPAAQGKTENCVAHNGSLIPVPGRDIKVQAWYQGGVSIMDFTDITKPKEIAFFDRGPVDAEFRFTGGPWSTYWYNGYIYSSEIARGLDVLDLVPSKYLTQNEIDAAKSVKMSSFNIQTQERLMIPNNMAVAKAYVDQLARSESVSKKNIANFRKAIAKAEKSGASMKDKKRLKKVAKSLRKNAKKSKNTEVKMRMNALASVLENPVVGTSGE